MIDVSAVRNLFPILNQKINNHDLIYLDNGATTQKPNSVTKSIEDYYKKVNSNVHRGAHYLSNLSTEKYEQTREKIKNFIGAKKTCEIILTKGTTDSINLIANTFGSNINEGDEVIISEMEHHSNIVPWQICCDKNKAVLKVVPILNSGEIDFDKFQSLLSKKTKLVSISHVSNVLGTINPIKKIIDLAHKFKAKVFIDGAQAASHIKLDVQKLNVDFYCFSAHKLYGPTGVGVLYGKESILNELEPYQGGGEMIKSVDFNKTTYADLPHKFEAGTPNIAGVVSFSKSIDFLESVGLDNIKSHQEKLLQYATKKLLEIKDVIIYGPKHQKAAIISFNIKNVHPYDVGVLLDKMGIAIRTGHHCAQPLMKKYNIPGTIRLSFAVYNTTKEIDLCIDAIKKSKKMLT
ncbi:MAG: cysteine desulfurase CsdA [Flavobacteriales bacterium]|nr:cysteine desulfurase CsdA [Flavobacteriales bacterium]|tara:strand:+ start:2550 stop:3764 length:1215 start_codon:yes stop_codon:yes gene_type:complete